MARFLIHWTESVDFCGYLDTADDMTVEEVHRMIYTDDPLKWYPLFHLEITGNEHVRITDSEVTKLPWYIERMED